MKKIISIFLSVCMILALGTTAFAASDMSSSVPGGTAIVNKNFASAPAELQKKILADKELAAAAKYAYMEIKTADEKSKDVILKARKTIIYSQSWSVDGSIRDLAGNIITIPKFSNLFPGWDVPTERASEATLADAASKRMMTLSAVTWFNSSYNVPAAVPGQTAPIFAGGYYYGSNNNNPTINFNGMTSGGRCNLGFSKLVGGYWVDVGWLVNQYAGSGFMLSSSSTVYGAYYGARVSTFDTPSVGYFWVGYYN